MVGGTRFPCAPVRCLMTFVPIMAQLLGSCSVGFHVLPCTDSFTASLGMTWWTNLRKKLWTIDMWTRGQWGPPANICLLVVLRSIETFFRIFRLFFRVVQKKKSECRRFGRCRVMYSIKVQQYRLAENDQRAISKWFTKFKSLAVRSLICHGLIRRWLPQNDHELQILGVCISEKQEHAYNKSAHFQLVEKENSSSVCGKREFLFGIV